MNIRRCFRSEFQQHFGGKMRKAIQQFQDVQEKVMGEYTCEDWAWSTDSFPRDLWVRLLLLFSSPRPPLFHLNSRASCQGLFARQGSTMQDYSKDRPCILGKMGSRSNFLWPWHLDSCGVMRGMHLFKVPEQNLIGSHLVLICQSQDDLRINWFISIDWWVLGQWRISSTFLLWGPRKQLVLLLLVRHLGS